MLTVHPCFKVSHVFGNSSLEIIFKSSFGKGFLSVPRRVSTHIPICNIFTLPISTNQPSFYVGQQHTCFCCQMLRFQKM